MFRRVHIRERESPDGETAYQEKAEERDLERRFLPMELLEMLGTQGTSLTYQDILMRQKEIWTVIFHADMTGFSEFVRDMQISEVYLFINETLSYSIPRINDNGGIIDTIHGAGVVALFADSMGGGLDAAIAVCEVVKDRRYSIGLCYGPVIVGVVGSGSRLAVQTLSAYTGLGCFLQQLGPKYYARILAVGSYTSRVEGFERKYNYRLLGYIYIKNAKSAEKIYDIFDGDEAAVRNRKRRTKMLFEKGVTFFTKREFAEARTYFIEVLKADRDDRAAREYVFLCDKYSDMAEEAPPDIYIERY